MGTTIKNNWRSLAEADVQALTAQQMVGLRRGLEKESLRAQPDGKLALTPHPQALGSTLTHPHITTDFSESQPELVTGVHARVEDCLNELALIHRVVYQELARQGDEMLWVSSMPCGLPTDETIPIGLYGTSNIGRAKSVYRMGLGHRYGRRMQTISGIHYNWSLPGLSSEQYFGLIRNFRRHAFLLLYLFGASPAVCGSFVDGREHGLQPLGKGAINSVFKGEVELEGGKRMTGVFKAEKPGSETFADAAKTAGIGVERPGWALRSVATSRLGAPAPPPRWT